MDASSIIVSEACASTGWVTTFYMEHNWALVRFSDELQAEIFGRQPFMLAPGGVGPTGLAKPVDGGYELTGCWKFGTGIVHGEWALLSGRIDAELVEGQLDAGAAPNTRAIARQLVLASGGGARQRHTAGVLHVQVAGSDGAGEVHRGVAAAIVVNMVGAARWWWSFVSQCWYGCHVDGSRSRLGSDFAAKW